MRLDILRTDVGREQIEPPDEVSHGARPEFDATAPGQVERKDIRPREPILAADQRRERAGNGLLLRGDKQAKHTVGLAGAREASGIDGR